MNTSMLIVKDFKLSYGDKVIIDHLNLALPALQIHGLVGLNGSGKTTFLKGLYGLKKPASGTVHFEEEPLTKKTIALLETDNFFYSRITGYEYLKLFQIRNKQFGIEDWNKLFELPLKSLVETYSTGMKKKLAFMGVICLNKPFYILDEPFNGVDLDTTQKLKTIIKALKESGKTIIITSHILESLTSLCDTISYLKGGTINFTTQKEAFEDLEHRIFGEFDKENESIVRALLNK